MFTNSETDIMLLCAAVAALKAALIYPLYVFVPATDRKVAVWQADATISIGKFNANGSFTELSRKSCGSMQGPNDWSVASSSSLAPEPVYEYRSGTLLIGTMAAGGAFTPTPGAPAIPFADYRYTLSSPRIWNLPGYFYLVNRPHKAANRGAWLPHASDYNPAK